MMRLSLADCFDPEGERFGLPTFPWRLAPEGLATRRQLRARELRPGGQDIAAQLLRPRFRREPLTAYLYRVDLAKPVRPMTPARWAALGKANAARRICPECRTDAGYVIPASLGMCVPCAYPEEQRAAYPTEQGEPAVSANTELVNGPDFEHIITRYADDIAFVAEERPATTLDAFIEQLRTAAHRLTVYARINGAEDLETAVTYLDDAIRSTGTERTVLLGQAMKYLKDAGEMVDEYRLMV